MYRSHTLALIVASTVFNANSKTGMPNVASRDAEIVPCSHTDPYGCRSPLDAQKDRMPRAIASFPSLVASAWGEE